MLPKSNLSISGWFLLKAVRENLFMPLSKLLVVCWQSLVFLGINPSPDPYLHVHMVLPLCAHLCPNIAHLIRTPVILGQGSVLFHYDPTSTNYICNYPISKWDNTLGYWGLGLQHINFGGTYATHNNL